MPSEHSRRSHPIEATRTAGVAPADQLSPADRYQELFEAVQTHNVFDDCKTFVDCAPRWAPEHIMHRYRRLVQEPDFDLKHFVHEYFIEPDRPAHDVTACKGDTLREHITRVWGELIRHPHNHPKNSSLLPLPEPYVVPGGRFRELYYWDSYFTMLGLAVDGHTDLVRTMTDNFAYLIDRYGHVPNANRSYYLSRSQPPAFVFMVRLCAKLGIADPSSYLEQLRKEYEWWMGTADTLAKGQASRRCVRLPDGAILNRYWDDRDTPREESYREDVATAARSSRPPQEVYRELRAGAETGWDFGSRWCAIPGELSTIKTTAIIPVDLNAFLFALESTLADLSNMDGTSPAAAVKYRERAKARHQAIDTWLWSDDAGSYLDYDHVAGSPRTGLTAACAVPLWVELATPEQAELTAKAILKRLLRPGGLATSEISTAEQWDDPNGWAPLHWMAIQGLRHYNIALADDLQERWLQSVQAVFDKTGQLVEKYAMPTSAAEIVGGAGGEYPLQAGFGWTNGVTAALLAPTSKVSTATNPAS